MVTTSISVPASFFEFTQDLVYLLIYYLLSLTPSWNFSVSFHIAQNFPSLLNPGLKSTDPITIFLYFYLCVALFPIWPYLNYEALHLMLYWVYGHSYDIYCGVWVRVGVGCISFRSYHCTVLKLWESKFISCGILTSGSLATISLLETWYLFQ